MSVLLEQSKEFHSSPTLRVITSSKLYSVENRKMSVFFSLLAREKK